MPLSLDMSEAPHILIADDERSIRLMLEAGLRLNGYRVTCVRSGAEALAALIEGKFDAVLSDIYMPDGGGLDLVRDIRALDAAIPVILMTAQGTVESAVEAVLSKATDFIGKPFEVSSVVRLIKRYLDARTEAYTAAGSNHEIPIEELSKSGLVGRSAPMVMVYKLIAQAARSQATVLLTGESGTGKELVARAIHDFSLTARRPFVSVNCSGLTDTLLEAELFGHVRGAFTGAMGERGGLFEAADSGTLFLDELASTSVAFQASLLRVLQSGEVRRVGSTQTRRVNVRVIGATNAPLRDLAAAGSFRSDLFYRLSVISIDLPPLRTRAQDVELLTNHFLGRFSDPGQQRAHLTQEALEALKSHDYPGNVRELENAIRRAIALSSQGMVTVDCLPPEIVAARHKGASVIPGFANRLIDDRPSMDELQRRYLQLVLEENGWNRRRAAVVLGLDRRTIQRLIARYKLRGASDFEVEEENDLEDDNEERQLDTA